MSMLKQLERLRRMHTLIKFHRTGTPEEFAQRLGISCSLLYRLLSELKSMGAPIHFCQHRQSYAYYESVEFRLEFVRVAQESKPAAKGQTKIAKVRPLPYPIAPSNHIAS